MYYIFTHSGVVSEHEGDQRTQKNEEGEGIVLEQSEITAILAMIN